MCNNCKKCYSLAVLCVIFCYSFNDADFFMVDLHKIQLPQSRLLQAYSS